MTKIFTKQENQEWTKTLPGKMCSACTALRVGNQVLMVKAGYKDHWTFPGGIVDENESPKDAAIRETFEEVGINISPESYSLLTVVYSESSSGGRDRFNFAFIADMSNKDIALSVPNDEIESAEWVDIKDIASRSGNKGSYVVMQNALIYGNDEKYAEVRSVR